MTSPPPRTKAPTTPSVQDEKRGFKRVSPELSFVCIGKQVKSLTFVLHWFMVQISGKTMLLLLGQ